MNHQKSKYKLPYFFGILAVAGIICVITIILGFNAANTLEKSNQAVQETNTNTIITNPIEEITESNSQETITTKDTTQPNPIEDSTNTNQETTNEIPITPEPTGISESELATHNSKTDCWVGFEGKVYDITSYLDRHPGGVNAIARHCGTSTEFENAFAREHGTSKVSLFMKIATYIGDASLEGKVQ